MYLMLSGQNNSCLSTLSVFMWEGSLKNKTFPGTFIGINKRLMNLNVTGESLAASP